MFKLSRFTLLYLCVVGSLSASAAVYYWDPKLTLQSGFGSGQWDTSTAVWADSLATPGQDAAWVNGNDAVFGGNPGADTSTMTVTLNTPITVGNLSFTTYRYVLNTTAGNALTITNGITANIASARSVSTIDGAGGLVVNGNQTFDMTSGVNIKTVLSGSGVITKTGSGAVGLSGNNTYTGKFVVSAGMLGITSDAALGAVPTSFQADNITLNGGTLVAGGVFSGPANFDNPVNNITLNANRGIVLGVNGGTFRIGYGPNLTMTVNGAVSGVGSLTKSDSGILVLNGDNTYQGNTTVSGNGTLILNGNNTYQGGTTITSGKVQVGTGGTTGSLGTGTITFGTGTGNYLIINRTDSVTINDNVVANGQINISSIAGGTVTFNGAFTGTSDLWIRGPGTVIINANANTNRTANSNNVIESGTLQLADVSSSASSPLGVGNLTIGQASTTSAGAGVVYTGDSAVATSFRTLSTAYGFINVTKAGTTLSLNSSFGAPGVGAGIPANLLTKLGAGTLSFDGVNDNTRMRVQMEEGTLLLGKNTNVSAHSVAGTDALILNNGTVRITGNNGDQIYDPSSVQVNGGTLDFNGASEAFNILYSTAANGVVTNTAGGSTSKLTLGTGNGGAVYTGKIQDGAGMMALEKKGIGALTLTGTNVLGGGTSVTNGRLIVTGSLTGSLTQVAGSIDGSSNFTGGFLGGTGRVGDVLTSSGTVSPGATASGAAIGTLTVSSLNMEGNGKLEIAISTSTLEASLLRIEGDLTLGFSASVLSLAEVGTDTGLQINTKFTIASYSGFWDTGTFLFGGRDLQDDSTFTFGSNTYRIDYDAIGTGGMTDVTLTVIASVPEPATGGLFVGGLALLCGWRRRRMTRGNAGFQTSLP